MVANASQIASVNPATEEVVRTFAAFTAPEVEAALAEAQAAFLGWRHTTFAERSARTHALAAVLRANADRYARLATLEMGKPIGEARAEIEKCALTCDFYADNAARFLADEPASTNAARSLVAFEPIGLVLAVMPWNYPFWQVFRFLAPALMAGNGSVLKHASNVPQSALACEEAVVAAGFPRGLFRALLIPGSAVERVVADPRIHAVTLTGSSETGSRVAALAGRALKKAVLELGGSDPFIVLADADLPLAAVTAARARNQNTGQSCIAAKRFLVAAPVAPKFERLFVQAVRALVVGDPLDPRTQIGPLAREDLRDALISQVDRSVAMGARVATGGRPLPRKGWFYEPTVLAEATDAMPVLAEETFGPVAAIRIVRDADEAIAIANTSEYGLGGALWTRDVVAGEALARRIESGAVFVNGMTASDPRLPFGGVKHSGFGRELGAYGIREFTNIKTIWIGPASAPPTVVAAE